MREFGLWATNYCIKYLKESFTYNFFSYSSLNCMQENMPLCVCVF